MGIIGCGAIAENFHLPALTSRPDLYGELIMVDPNAEQAERFKAEFKADRTASSHTDILDEVDAVIVTAPHQFHHPIAKDCLERGIDVLLEKPLCETAAEAEELVALADEHDAVLAVNNTRRLIPACREVKRLVEFGAVGAVRSIDFREGDLFGWPLASGGVFQLAKGVLLDVGAHVVDLTCWWLGERPTVESYADDSFGGPEATARLSLRAGEATATIHLSWLAKQRNSVVIEGADGRIEWSIYDWNHCTLTKGGREQRVTAKNKVADYGDLALPLVEGFLAAAAGTGAAAVTGRDVLDSIGVMDDAYSARTRLEMPWQEAEAVR